VSDKTKQEHMIEFIKSIKEIDDCIQPYLEQKKELRKEYVENKWLTKDDIKYTMKAYRLLKDNTDMTELDKVYSEIQELVGDDDGSNE
jgi:5-bromo-4-chloroindolyl phosphate hydrolysis protein